MTIESFPTQAVDLGVRFPDFPRAACFADDVDPETFFPGRGGGWDADVAAAVAVCAECPERLPCLTWALEYDERGVWGGTTEPDRRSMKAGRPPLTCIRCGHRFADSGNPGPKPKRCPTCRARDDR